MAAPGRGPEQAAQQLGVPGPVDVLQPHGEAAGPAAARVFVTAAGLEGSGAAAAHGGSLSDRAPAGGRGGRPETVEGEPDLAQLLLVRLEPRRQAGQQAEVE